MLTIRASKASRFSRPATAEKRLSLTQNDNVRYPGERDLDRLRKGRRAWARSVEDR